MTDMTPTDLIARVRELDQAATAGPWLPGNRSAEHNYFDDTYVVAMSTEFPGTYRHFAQLNNWYAAPADARLIAEYRTLAPKLADELEAAQAEVGRRRDLARELCNDLAGPRECLGECSTFGHAPECPDVSLAAAWRQDKEELRRVRADNARLREDAERWRVMRRTATVQAKPECARWTWPQPVEAGG